MTYFNVRPRYTSGSPAMVDAATAKHVAQQEKIAYQDALSGLYGDEDKARAEREGVKGIVECVLREQRARRQNGFLVRDLLTGEDYWRPQQRGDGEDIEPDCLYDEDHEIDPTTLRLSIVNRSDVVIIGRCRLCSREGETQPIAIRFG